MVSYKEALLALMRDDRKTGIVHLLEKQPMSFSAIKERLDYKHNQTLTRGLRQLEKLGVVDHTYRRGSDQVFSFYAVTGFGREVARLHGEIESILYKVGPRRASRKKVLNLLRPESETE